MKKGKAIGSHNQVAVTDYSVAIDNKLKVNNSVTLDNGVINNNSETLKELREFGLKAQTARSTSSLTSLEVVVI